MLAQSETYSNIVDAKNVTEAKEVHLSDHQKTKEVKSLIGIGGTCMTCLHPCHCKYYPNTCPVNNCYCTHCRC